MYSIYLVLFLVSLGEAQLPSLVSFSLSLTPPELLTLTFDTTLQSSGCDVSKLTLQNSSTLVAGGSHTPEGGGSCSFIGGLTVTLNAALDSEDWAAIQANIYLATEPANTYLSMQAGFLSQGSNSPISSSSAIQVTSHLFAANNNPPAVVEVILDLDAGILTLRLYEGSVYLASGPIEFTETGGGFTLNNYTTPDNVRFFFPLPPSLLHSFKRASPPFTASLPPGLFRDSSGTLSPEQDDLSVTILPDSTPPATVSFVFDLDTGNLSLTFDEPIIPGSIDITTGIYLTGAFEGSNNSVSVLADRFFTANLDTELSILVSTTTLNSVKFDTSLCTSLGDCLLGVSSTSLSDTMGNTIPTSLSNIITSFFVPDTTQPELLSYTLNLETSSVTLVFSEPINPLSIDLSGISLDLDPDNLVTSGGDLIEYQPVPLGGASSIMAITDHDTVTTLRLETSTLLNLKLLVSSGNITCSVEDFTAEDTSGNEVVPIPPTTSFPPSLIVLDTSPPLLLDFIAGSPNSRQLTFIFSEPVNIPSWNTSALVLTLLTTEGSIDYSFSDGSVEGNENMNVVVFTIGDSEYMLSSLSEHYQDAYIRGSLGVTTRGSLIEDLFGNPLQPLILPLIFNATIPGQSPELLTADFDLDTGTLHLMFSDLVLASFSAGKIRFQDDSVYPSPSLTLTNNGSYASVGGLDTSVSLTLTSHDLNGLKLNPFLATSSNNTFVVLSEDFAYGIGSIPVVARNGTQVRLFTPDTTEPAVTKFELDLDSDTLAIDFDEPVLVDTFDETRILFLNSTSVPTSEAAVVHLSATYSLVQGNATSIRALISQQDAIDIKRQPLCYSVNNCFVALDRGLVTDISGNEFLGSVDLMQVSSVSADVTPPQLLSFPVFDIDSGLFTLVFSEPINGSSTNFAQVEFHTTPVDSNTSITLTEGFTSEDHIEIDFHMSRQDLNRLKSDPGLCTNRDNCWIRLPSFFVTDIGSNPFIHSRYESDVEASYHQPTVFLQDQTAPVLENAAMDLNRGTLTLSFSEVIAGATFSPSDITLLQSPSSFIFLTLSPGSIFSLTSSGAEATITLTNDDLNWLKANVNIFTSADNSYLSLATNLIDVSGNHFQNISRSVGFQVQGLVPDQTGPQVVSFDSFDLENNFLVVSFDEPVNPATLNVTQVTLVSHPTDNRQTYTFTGAEDVFATDDRLLSVVIILTNTDRVQIKLDPFLATVRSNTYIAFGGNAVKDTSCNTNLLVPISEPVQLSTGGYGADISPASLVGFGLDLDSSLLSLTFDDVIDSSSVDPTLLTLQNKASSPTSSVTFSTTSRPLNGNSDKLYVSLSEEDLLRLKLNLDLATSVTNTFVSIEADFASDIEGRAVPSVLPSLALPILLSSLVPDTTSPSLLVFSIDMDAGTLQLNFLEPVLKSSLNSSQLTLHGQSSGIGSSLTLSQATSILTTNDASLNVEFELVQSDLNHIKHSPDIAIDTRTTFISFTSDLVTDVSGNHIETVFPNASIGATDFILDTTPPELQEFNADLTPVSKIFLTFSETVRQMGKIETSISLMNAPQEATVVIQLSEEDKSDQTGFSTIEISLSPPVITRLLVDSIASSVDSLYLSLSVGVVSDTSGNTVIPVTAFRVQQLYKACFSNTYNNETLGECLECPGECEGSCTGPAPIVGPRGCDSCLALLLDQQGKQLTCADATSSCQKGYFSTSLSSITSSLPPTVTESTLLCQRCHYLCSSCDGPTTSDCLTCSSAFLTNSTTPRISCLESCDQTSASDCVMCHEQCSGCTGPTDRDCVMCREDSTVDSQSRLVCVPQCQGDTFLSSESGMYRCQECDSECNGCRGSKNTDCTTCRNANFTTNGVCMCLAMCPSDYYEAKGTCLPCHEYCIGCTGPSSRNCTECVEDEVNGECVPFCPIGMEYDTSEKQCVLTSVMINLIIASGVVGGAILPVLVIPVAVWAGVHYKKKRDSKGVFFVSATFNTPGQELHSLRDT